MSVGEWDQRELCPDGACVGVIGPDGTCKVCGHAAQNWGDERTRGLLEPETDDDEKDGHDDDDLSADHDDEDDETDYDDQDEDDDEDDEEEAEDEDVPAPVLVTSTQGSWGQRELCPDGACIGVIGPGGTCKVCGRASEHAANTRPASAAPAPAGTATAGDERDDAIAPARCADPSCNGARGSDGTCALCGKVVA